MQVGSLQRITEFQSLVGIIINWNNIKNRYQIKVGSFNP